MDLIEVSAPGKLVLLGEYSVLFGAPAIVAAVDRRAVVTLCPLTGDRWEVAAPGLAPRTARFAVGPGNIIRWHDERLGRDSFGLVEKLMAGIMDSGSVDIGALPPLSMTLDTRAFFEATSGGRAKLGLGSSAALTVALVSALEAWAAGGDLPESTPDLLQRLVVLHRGVQAGAGSGIDIAASVLGGVTRFQLAGDGSVAEAVQINLSEELLFVFVWTGRSASTGDFLERLRACLVERPQEVRPALDGLGIVSSEGVTAVAEGDSEGFLDAVDAFWEALDNLGTAIEMPILSQEHRTLHQLAVACGVRYKPSGAGGGDLGVGVTTDVAAAMEMADRAAAKGFQILELRVDSSGVKRPGS